METEREKILRILAGNKISVEEAGKLLDAIREENAPAGESPSTPSIDKDSLITEMRNSKGNNVIYTNRSNYSGSTPLTTSKNAFIDDKQFASKGRQGVGSSTLSFMVWHSILLFALLCIYTLVIPTYE